MTANRPPANRSTRQRQVILEELRAVTSHPTADELYHLVRRRLPKVSLGTVYRNLDLLSAQGQILRLDAPGAQMRFDATTDLHHHIRCVDCGRITDLWIEHAPPPLDRVREHTDFEVLSQRVAFTGRCPACRDALDASN
ncbi:MAG: transcriptional repressor [Armatimonadota bacterium]